MSGGPFFYLECSICISTKAGCFCYHCGEKTSWKHTHLRHEELIGVFRSHEAAESVRLQLIATYGNLEDCDEWETHLRVVEYNGPNLSSEFSVLLDVPFSECCDRYEYMASTTQN